MDRLDIELYAERLSGVRARVADELADARLRLAWAEIEDRTAEGMSAERLARLRALGVLGGAGLRGVAAAVVRERSADLAALDELQVRVEALRLCPPQAGVTATSRPPSSS